MKNVTTLGKLIVLLLFRLLLLSINMYTKNTRNELAHLVMGTIFLFHNEASERSRGSILSSDEKTHNCLSRTYVHVLTSNRRVCHSVQGITSSFPSWVCAQKILHLSSRGLFIININFFGRVFSKYTEVVTTSLIPIDAILSEICAFIKSMKKGDVRDG